MGVFTVVDGALSLSPLERWRRQMGRSLKRRRPREVREHSSPRQTQTKVNIKFVVFNRRAGRISGDERVGGFDRDEFYNIVQSIEELSTFTIKACL